MPAVHLGKFAFTGKMDMGQGLFTAIGQIVAEELDVPFKAVKVIMGDTATSVNQGGASGSTGIQLGGKQMRVAAAEARRVLLDMASDYLKIPVERLTVNDHARRQIGLDEDVLVAVVDDIAVNRDKAGPDDLLHFAARAIAEIGQQAVEPQGRRPLAHVCAS